MSAIELDRLLGAIRQPEHTGENRCVPCTVVNVVLAAVLSGIVAMLSIPLAIVAFGLFGLTIYLRGYLVPGTPTLTKTYLPERVLWWFDKDPLPAVTVDPDAEEVDVEGVLRGAGALEPCRDGEDLCLDDTFRASWYEAFEDLEETSLQQRLAAILDVGVDQIALTDYGRTFVLLVDDVQVGQWESRAALVADVAADEMLRERVDGWSELTVERRSGLWRGLRVYLDRCPECGGAVELSDETVESCCSSREVIASRCRQCEERLFELRASKLGD